MWDWLAPALSALGVGTLTLIGSYAVARRQRSGRVATSEATELWKESSTLRRELYQQVNELRTQQVELNEKNIALQEALSAIRLAHQDCERRIEELRERIADLPRKGEAVD